MIRSIQNVVQSVANRKPGLMKVAMPHSNNDNLNGIKRYNSTTEIS